MSIVNPGWRDVFNSQWRHIFSPLEENLTFVSTNATITPSLTLSGGAPAPQWVVNEADGEQYFYNTANFTHNRVFAGDMQVQLLNTAVLGRYVTEIDFRIDGIISAFCDLHIPTFVNLTSIKLFGNLFTGDLSAVAWPTELTKLYLHLNLFTGDLSSVAWPTGLTDIRINANLFTGDLSAVAWPTGLVFLYLSDNSFTGDLSSVAWPTGLTELYLHHNSFTGDLSAVAWPTELTLLYLNTNGFTGGMLPTVGTSPLTTYRIDSNGLSQPAVDAIALAGYNNRANFTYANPTFNVGGTNAAPSGIYQDGDPPTTGKEYIYEVVNDPESEGFNQHVWVYTA